MSKEDEEIERIKHLFEDEPDLVVDRQSQTSFSILPIVIAVFVVYLLFNLFSESKSTVQSFTDSVSSKVEKFEEKVLKSRSNETSLHQLVTNGKVEEIKRQLFLDKGNINDVVNGMTPIMLAASYGNVEIIDLLFTQGADPNKRGSMERTALQYAAEKNHIEVAKRLLAYGADIDAYDNGRLTPLIMAASRGYTELGLLFVEKGADVNIQHVDGWTALIDATAHGDVKFVKALLKAGADKELSAKNGKKALDYAKEYGFENMVKILSK
ncbi:MAG: ankyrin repeat domain-containing protein [Proteobacteria bacterium]|nr:ankyrin repeat domain-containing protein [Pseudomonadota bacterium]